MEEEIIRMDKGMRRTRYSQADRAPVTSGRLCSGCWMGEALRYILRLRTSLHSSDEVPGEDTALMIPAHVCIRKSHRR